MLRSNVKLEKESFYYVLLVSVIVTAAIIYLFSQSIKTLPLGLITFSGLAFFIFTIINAEAVMGLRNALWLKGIAITVTFIGEVIGVNYGWIFGSYDYTNALGLKVLGVPILVILLWEIFIYTSYMLITHTVDFRWKQHMSFKLKAWYALLVALLTGLATTAIDFIIDPIAVHLGWWIWDNGGAYFPSIAGGVPVSNFVGWAFLTTLSVFLYKLIEKPYEEKETIFEYASILPYFTTLITVLLVAHLQGQAGPSLVGGFMMLAFILFFVLAKTNRQYPLPHEFKR